MNVFDDLPKEFGISPIKTHGSRTENIQKQIKGKLERLQEKIEVCNKINISITSMN